MKAIVHTKYGSPAVLSYTNREIPLPKAKQVQIQIHTSAVNPLDWHLLRADPFFVRLVGFGLFSPKKQILGADFSGRVTALGERVEQFKIGDEVFGSGLGTFAEYHCVDERFLIRKPASISFEQAAATPVAGLTALQALRDHGKLQSGQRLLINGASGGVGTFAIQIAKSFDAHVTAVCSTRNLELVKSIGADQVIDYTQEDFRLRQNEFDLILDNAAFGSIPKTIRALSPSGIYILIGGATSNFMFASLLKPLYSMTTKKTIASCVSSVTQNDLLTLSKLIETGKVRPVIDRTYPLSEVPEAIRYIETGHARGKVLIRVQP